MLTSYSRILSLLLVLAFKQFTVGASASSVHFAREVQPILVKHCYACHGPETSESGLSFVDRDSALAKTDSDEPAIIPGNAQASELMRRISTSDLSERMPPEGDPLSAREIQTLNDWIAQGVAWQKHWAFDPLSNPSPPAVPSKDWNTNPIDSFIRSSLDNMRLLPNPPASRRVLIRRAYYDLIGLPPSREEIEAFVADPDPRAFERVVDHLLSIPQYGERWGRHWLDLVRYAETNSFERDNPKPNVWKYRDYVIESFNMDKPYDLFIHEQLAGDELDQVTQASLIATGFYRLGIWDDEPADPLQARYDELDDIMTTVGQVFLGLTINCARCHDHKIDPIPQTDYYSMLAFFADVSSYGHRGDQVGFNQINVSAPELNAEYERLDQRRKVLEDALMEIEQQGIVKMTAEDQRATEGPRRDREKVLKEKLRDHLDRDTLARYEDLGQQLTEVQHQTNALPQRESVLGLNKYREVDATRVLFRGNPHSPAAEVRPAFPELFESEVPVIEKRATPRGSVGRRRVIADWITSPSNRLTSRVIVNRVWQFHFGRGIVRSSSNLGQLGTPPTHPELLDFLANWLMQHDWKIKDLHRLIMSSQTYQLASQNNPDSLAVDPGNDYFWKFDSRRLSAEEVRDSVLAVSGSLNLVQGGPSIYPKLSAEVLAGQSRPGSGWGDSSDTERNRRSVYIHVKRSLLTPLLEVFDFPEPDRSCEARFATLQPGQALSLLNSDFIHEQAVALSKRIDAARISDAEVARRAIHTVLQRDVTQEEIAEAEGLIAELQHRFDTPRERAVELYCLTLLNWNEFLFVD